jgi:hypothetical protein
MNKIKQFAAAALLGGLLLGGATAPTAAKAEPDPVAAIIMSLVWTGAGEWYNSGFSIVECILGDICFCVKFASLIDAAAGRTDDGIRFDFWSSPNK